MVGLQQHCMHVLHCMQAMTARNCSRPEVRAVDDLDFNYVLSVFGKVPARHSEGPA